MITPRPLHLSRTPIPTHAASSTVVVGQREKIHRRGLGCHISIEWQRFFCCAVNKLTFIICEISDCVCLGQLLFHCLNTTAHSIVVTITQVKLIYLQILTHTHTHTPVSYTHLDVYKRQIFTKIESPWDHYNSGTYAKNYLILFEFAAVIVCHRKKTLQVNYPFPLTDLHQKQ